MLIKVPTPKIRKGPAGKGKGGSFAFKDKSKYDRKAKQPRDEQ